MQSHEAREAKLEALHDQLTASVAALVSGDDWRQAMEFAARFRSRSFNNTILIYVQHSVAHAEGRVPEPAPTYVAGFKQWQSLGRQVMKGQSGYAILAPVTSRFATRTPAISESWRRLSRGEKPQWGEVTRTRMVGLRPAHVWDVSQTEGDPVPAQPMPVLLQGQAPEGLWDGLAAQVEARGFILNRVPNAAAIGGANGVTDYLAREVSVRTDMDPSAQTKTLCHELGHVLLHGPENEDAALHRGIAEVEAESVAVMVGAAHDLDTTSYTIPYVTSWASSVPDRTPVEVVQETAERVRRTAVTILDQLDTAKIGGGDPPGLDRAVLAATREAPVTELPSRSEPAAVVGL